VLLSAAAPSAEALASFQGNQVAQTAEYSELLGFDPASVMNAKTGSKVAPQAYQAPTATPVASKGVDPAVKNILAQTSVYVVSSDASKTASFAGTSQGTLANPTAITSEDAGSKVAAIKAAKAAEAAEAAARKTEATRKAGLDKAEQAAKAKAEAAANAAEKKAAAAAAKAEKAAADAEKKAAADAEAKAAAEGRG
jgi:hypothetical protein